MEKHLRNIFLIIAIILFVAAFVTVNKNSETTSFILSVCALALTFVGIFTKSEKKPPVKKKSDKKRRPVIEYIKDLDSVLRTILQMMLGLSIFFIIGGFFSNSSPNAGGLYELLAKRTGNIFARILGDAITGAALGAGLALFFITYVLLTIGGIILCSYVFGIAFKYMPIIYGGVSGALSMVFTSVVFGIIFDLNTDKEWAQYGLIICAMVLGVVCGFEVVDKKLK